MKLMKKLVNNKSGFSLVEVLIAMTILALVAGPICRCFMMSSEVSLKARKRMCANDAAQAIMEGFSDKTYNEIVATFNAIDGTVAGADPVAGVIKLTDFNDGFYNNNGFKDSKGAIPGISGVSKNSITFDSGVVAAEDINVSENIARVHHVNDLVYKDVKNNLTHEKGLYMYRPTNNVVSVVEFCDVKSGTFDFDVVVSFYPMAHATSDAWYPYLIYLTVYENEPDDPAAEPLSILYMKSGTRNKRQQ